MVPLFSERIALIAGGGALPLEILGRLQGKIAVVYSLNEGLSSGESVPETTEVIKMVSPDLEWLLRDLERRNIRKLLMAGYVPKKLMYMPEALDPALRAVIGKLASRDDHSLLGAIVAAIESHGVEVMPYRDVILDILAPVGVIAGRNPTEEEKDDIAWGVEIIRRLLPLSFGQTIVVKSRSVVAVEAMEGTDRTIERAGTLVKGGVVIKMMRPDQDERYDLPTIGPTTLEAMAKGGLSCLAVEAGRTIILEKEKTFDIAEKSGIAVWGIG